MAQSTQETKQSKYEVNIQCNNTNIQNDQSSPTIPIKHLTNNYVHTIELVLR